MIYICNINSHKRVELIDKEGLMNISILLTLKAFIIASIKMRGMDLLKNMAVM